MEIWQKNALKNLAALLAESRLSQTAFAKKAKINPGHLNMVLNGKRPVTRQLIQTAAPILKKATDWFYEDHSPQSHAIAENPTALAMAQVIAGQQTEIELLKSQLVEFSKGLSDEERTLLFAFRRAPDRLLQLATLYQATHEEHYAKEYGALARAIGVRVSELTLQSHPGSPSSKDE